MRAVMHAVLALVSAAVLLAGTPAARAQSQGAAPAASPAEATARDAIGQLRSPYCPGLMLEVCPSPQAELLRDSIRDLAAEGWSASRVVEWVLERHGEEWRAVPKRSGAGLWAWVLPPVALLVGLGLVITKLRGMTGRAVPDVPTAGGGESPLSEVDRDRLAAALRDWDDGAGEEEP